MHTVDEYREQGLARLDLIDKGLWAIVHTEHIAVSSKGVCYDEAGNVVLDDGPRIKAYAALRRNRNCALVLPAPTRPSAPGSRPTSTPPSTATSSP
jgi:hypothetical protein